MLRPGCPSRLALRHRAREPRSRQSENAKNLFMQEEAPEHPDNLDPHFSNPFQWIFTLEPLRTEGIDALDVRGIEGLPFRALTLRELEVHSNNSLHDIIIRKSDNLFGPRGVGAGLNPIPPTGTLVRACFDLHLHREDRPRALHIRPPYWIQLLPSCDLRPILRWLEKQKFRIHETIVRALVILALACVSAFSPILDLDDEDDDPQRGATLVVWR